MDAMLNRLAQQERYFDLTQEQVDFLRTLPVTYDPNMENGATVLDLHRGRSVPGRIVARLWDHFFLSVERKSELEASFQIFLAFAELAPGRYAVARDDVADYRPNVEDSFRVRLQQEFQFTDQHLKLLNHARGTWDDFYNTLIINPKRPYGDLTYFELDMAEVLGISLERDAKGDRKIAKAQQATFDALFKDLPLSLRIFLKHASISPGKFYRKPAGWGAWQRLTTG